MPTANDVTVVIPTIPGRERHLERALDSVRAQEVAPHVLVVPDRERRGAAWARNEGLAAVRTTWTAWLDDDDQLLPNHLRVLLRGARKSHADLVYSYPKFIGGRDPLATMRNGQLVRPFGVAFGEEQKLHLIHHGNFIPVTYIVRTELAQRVGGMPEPGSPEAPRVWTHAGVSADCEDYLFLLRLLEAGAKFHHVAAVTWVYFIHGDNTGGRSAAREAAWRQTTSR